MSQKRFFFSLLCHGVSEVSHFLSVTLPSCRPPVRAQLSQPEEECVPARPLPPHQPHPFCPRLPLRPSFTMIHTQRESSSPLVFFFFFPSLPPSLLLLILLTVSLGDAQIYLLTSAHVSTHRRTNTCLIYHRVLAYEKNTHALLDFIFPKRCVRRGQRHFSV